MAHLARLQISADIIQRYLKFENNPLFRQLMKIPGGVLGKLAQPVGFWLGRSLLNGARLRSPAGFRDRLLADESFIVKVGIELGIGLVCKLAAEKEKRRSAFKREIDFVFANVIMVRPALSHPPAPAALRTAECTSSTALQDVGCASPSHL